MTTASNTPMMLAPTVAARFQRLRRPPARRTEAADGRSCEFVRLW